MSEIAGMEIFQMEPGFVSKDYREEKKSLLVENIKGWREGSLYKGSRIKLPDLAVIPGGTL